MAKLRPVEFDATREIMVDGLFDPGLGFLLLGQRAQMDYARDRFVYGVLPRPTHDELFPITVQVLFVERRGVHRVEQLAHIPKVQLDATHVRLAMAARGRIHDQEQARKQPVC